MRYTVDLCGRRFLKRFPRQMAIPDLETFDVDEHHAAAAAHNMVFVFWYKDTTLVAFQRMCDKLTQLAAECPEGVGVCQVVGLHATPPEQAARDAITKLIKEGVGGQLRHYSIVHEGTGFKAASVRAIISASQLMARSKSNVAVFRSIAEAARWHAQQQRAIGRPEQPREIAEIITYLMTLVG